MKDVERKVTEFLQEDAADAHRSAQMPEGMTRRIRRHQTRTALVTGVATIAIVAVSVAGFRAFLPLATDRQTPAGPGFGGVPTTTAALSWATITYPSDWHLVELQGDAGFGIDASVLMLTNYEKAASVHSRICPRLLPADDRVGFIVGHNPSAVDPQRLSPGTIPVSHCWEDQTPLSPDDAYSARMWASDLATQADRGALQAAFDSLNPPENPPDAAAGTSLASPADVLFAGGAGQDAWRIVSYPSGPGETTMEMRTGGAVNSATSISGTPVDVRDGEAIRLELAFPRWPMAGGGPSGVEDLGPAVLYGVTMRGIETIEIRNGSDPRLPAQRRPLPSYGKGWDAFAIPMDAVPLGGSVVSEVFNVKLDSLAVFSSSSSFSIDNPEGAAHMALLAADTWFADHGTYEGFNVQEASKIDPSLDWTDPTMNRRGDTVDITEVTPDSILMNSYPKDSYQTFCAAHTPDGTFAESVQALEIGDCTSDGAARTRLRNALTAAKVFFTDGDTYEGLTPEKASAIEPSVTFNTSAVAIEGEVSIRDVSADAVLLVTKASGGKVFCLAEDPGRFTDQPGSAPSGIFYGSVGDPQAVNACVGGSDSSPGG